MKGTTKTKTKRLMHDQKHWLPVRHHTNSRVSSKTHSYLNYTYPKDPKMILLFGTANKLSSCRCWREHILPISVSSSNGC
jgi:hypothetical protein